MCCPWFFFFFFSSRRRHTRFDCDWSSDVCSSDLYQDFSGNIGIVGTPVIDAARGTMYFVARSTTGSTFVQYLHAVKDRKSTRLNSSHSQISYAVFCLKKKKKKKNTYMS